MNPKITKNWIKRFEASLNELRTNPPEIDYWVIQAYDDAMVSQLESLREELDEIS